MGNSSIPPNNFSPPAGQKITLEFFSASKIALSRETKLHPELSEKLACYAPSDFENKLAETAAYCGVMVDGTYMPSEIDRLCEILLRKLQAKRSTIIIS